MHLTTDLPNRLRLETHDDGAGHYVTCVCCTDGCNQTYLALEHDSEQDAQREHEEAVASLRHDAH